MKIFIASSTKHLMGDDNYKIRNNEHQKIIYEEYQNGIYSDGNPKSLVIQIVETIRKSNVHDVKPWWENGVIPYGANILDKLLELTDICNGGIFIFGKDDPLLGVQNEGKPRVIARDNVILECGMFLSKNGKDNTFVLIEDWKDEKGQYHKVDPPSDFSGIKNIYFRKNNIDNAIDQLNNLITESSNKNVKSSLDKTVFYFSKNSKNRIINKEYIIKRDEWVTKALYLGHKSAGLWREIENNTDYDGYYNDDLYKKIFDKLDNNFCIDNVISLGPGCGKLDESIVTFLVSKNVKYIPIDINSCFALMSAEKISKRSTVPFAIINDFETYADEIRDVLREKHIIEQNNLYLMLGGTFANLSMNESDFIVNIKEWMSPGDYLLLDIFIKNDDDNIERYSLKKKPGEQIQQGSLKDSQRRFLVNLMHNKYPLTQVKTVEDMSDNYEEYIDEKILNQRNSKSVVPNTLTHACYYKKNNDILVATRRYNFNDFLAFISRYFTVIMTSNVETGVFNPRAVFLLKYEKKLKKIVSNSEDKAALDEGYNPRVNEQEVKKNEEKQSL